ncbi:MAG: DNA-binding protein [Alphaproteobacteria bacterium]|nr:DNA-binding protein [Alphaproteobacteria bacterium]
MRTIRQPGKPARPRVLSVAASSGGELRIVVPEGTDLLNGLARALTGAGVASAAVFLNGGRFARMQYLTGQPCRDGKRVATYGAPTTLVGPVTLLSGNAFLGIDEMGKSIVHCHAVVVDRDGAVHGGHLPPGVCTVGPGGVVALAAALADAALAVRYDAETNYPIFHPMALGAAHKVAA